MDRATDDPPPISCRVTGADGSGLAGVAVSDGLAVAVTGGDGAAELPDRSAPFVWVSRPTGYDTDTWFARRPAEGPWHAEFALRPVEQPLPVTFVHVTDLHVSEAPEPAHLPLPDGVYGFDTEGSLFTKPLTRVADLVAALTEVAALDGPHGPPRFGVATGDLTDHGTPGEFARLAEALAASPLPVHVLPGNHDHYGHRTEPRPDDRPVDSEGMGTGTTTRYEESVGPRWWSLTHAGLRLVALDWFSHRLGLDRDQQEAWLASDLATAPAGTPVLFLTHDQMPSDFYARVTAASPHVRIVGSLSGHWHTSRVVRVDGQLHANTGNTTFGSFDWAPAHARLCGWDGQGLTFRTVALGTVDRAIDEAVRSATFAARPGPAARPDAARWSVRLPGAVHLARPLAIDDAVVVAWSDDDAARGGLACHDLATGALRWEVALDAPVRGGAAHVDAGDPAGVGVVVAVTVSGGVVAVDPGDGSVRWRRQLGDPLTAWVYAAPVPVDGGVAVGEPRAFAVLDLTDGAVRWVIDDADEFENVATINSGVVQDDTLVVPFAMLPRHTVALDPADGAVRWSIRDLPHRSPVSDVVAAPDGRDVVLARFGGRVERIGAASGELRWAARVPAAFVPGRPVVTDDAVYVTTALGHVHRLDAATGSEVWSLPLPDPGVLAMGPYRRTGPAAPAGPTLVGSRLVQPTADGHLHVVDIDDGTALGTVGAGGPVTAPAVPVGADVAIATADGMLARIGL